MQNNIRLGNIDMSYEITSSKLIEVRETRRSTCLHNREEIVSLVRAPKRFFKIPARGLVKRFADRYNDWRERVIVLVHV